MLEVFLAAICFVLSLVIFFDAADINSYKENRKKSNIKFAVSGLLVIMSIALVSLAII